MPATLLALEFLCHFAIASRRPEYQQGAALARNYILKVNGSFFCDGSEPDRTLTRPDCPPHAASFPRFLLSLASTLRVVALSGIGPLASLGLLLVMVILSEYLALVVLRSR